MTSVVPQGSKIELSNHNGHHLITIPHSSGSVMRYFIGAFLLFWLGGWFMGFTSALDNVLSGKGGAFIIFWLGGWTIGGILVVFTIYRIFRKAVPEQILLNRPNLAYDTGVPPFNVSLNMHASNQKGVWKSLFARQKKYEFMPNEIETLQLRETDSGNRLTIDQGSKRHELGAGVSEIEREWLYDYIKKNYF